MINLLILNSIYIEDFYTGDLILSIVIIIKEYIIKFKNEILCLYSNIKEYIANNTSIF